MKTRDVFAYSFSAIKLRKLRAGLTTLGVVIGIAAIVALLSITQGLQIAITRQLQTGFATDTLIVSTGGGFGGAFGQGALGGATSSGFTLVVNDTEIINNITDVDTSTAIIQRTGQIKSGTIVQDVTIVGVDFAEYQNIYSSTFVPENGGSIPSNPENDRVVIGSRINDPQENGTSLFTVNSTVDIIWLNATGFPIVRNETYIGNVTAILPEIGGFGVGGPSDYSIYIPISQAQSFFGTDECNVIVVKLTDDEEATIDSVSAATKETFKNQVSVTSAVAVLNTLSSVFSIIQLFLAGIAAISLLVAGIGIMNIMIVSLMERTREIGILKALGTKSRTVLLIFLNESAIIGLIGAVIGIATGWGLANVVALAFRGGGLFMGNQAVASAGMTITPVLTATVLLGALGFGVGVSVIFALYPAWRASKLKPVEALRYE
ncbi:ABC transporter permease [Candidatus Bathyarchaeota archaeon]|nr:ABC transporter permease [Candidatus Bathyarchaeota archaeon]